MSSKMTHTKKVESNLILYLYISTHHGVVIARRLAQVIYNYFIGHAGGNITNHALPARF